MCSAVVFNPNFETNIASVWNACDYQVACHAGIEKGIAATKSFTSQMLCLILISLKLIENIVVSDGLGKRE